MSAAWVALLYQRARSLSGTSDRDGRRRLGPGKKPALWHRGHAPRRRAGGSLRIGSERDRRARPQGVEELPGVCPVLLHQFFHRHYADVPVFKVIVVRLADASAAGQGEQVRTPAALIPADRVAAERNDGFGRIARLFTQFPKHCSLRVLALFDMPCRKGEGVAPRAVLVLPFGQDAAVLQDWHRDGEIRRLDYMEIVDPPPVRQADGLPLNTNEGEAIVDGLPPENVPAPSRRRGGLVCDREILFRAIRRQTGFAAIRKCQPRLFSRARNNSFGIASNQGWRTYWYFTYCSIW